MIGGSVCEEKSKRDIAMLSFRYAVFFVPEHHQGLYQPRSGIFREDDLVDIA